MNKYKCKFEYKGVYQEMEVEAETNYEAIIRCLGVMARRYGIESESKIRNIVAEKLEEL